MDVNRAKVDLVNAGTAPVVEERIGDLVAEVVRTGALRATGVREAVVASDVSLVCVGTPSEPNGSLCTTCLERVTEQIGAALVDRGGRHTVVFRRHRRRGARPRRGVPGRHQGSGRAVGAAPRGRRRAAADRSARRLGGGQAAGRPAVPASPAAAADLGV